MHSVLLGAAVGSGFCFGAFAGSFAHTWWENARRRRQAKGALGNGSVLEAASVSLESSGISAWVIEKAVFFTYEEVTIPRFFEKAFSRSFAKHKDLICKAGLGRVLSDKGFAALRVYGSVGGAFLGALLGAVFSFPLCLIGATAGLLLGWNSLVWAMREESRCRAFSAEQQFSQMIEVIVLGMKSGMSFDGALGLYCDSFKGSLSAVAASALAQWKHSLISRNEGLRQIAESYDSLLFGRFAENVIRSLRFGTSLTENLSLLAVEARAIRKAKLEERVAKAPVKMLLPVGALILPAMLILVMGPIMLDLMNEF